MRQITGVLVKQSLVALLQGVDVAMGVEDGKGVGVLQDARLRLDLGDDIAHMRAAPESLVAAERRPDAGSFRLGRIGGRGQGASQAIRRGDSSQSTMPL